MKNALKMYKWVWIWAGLSILFALIIHFVFSIPAPCKYLEAVWNAGDILTYISMVALALLAFWQNQKLYQETQKQEKRKFAIEKYVLFVFKELEATFFDDDMKDNETRPIETGFNGNMAFWKYDSITQKNLQIKLTIENIGNYPATRIMVADKNGQQVKDTNILHSTSDENDRKYILNGKSGIMIINVVLDDLFKCKPKELKYYLTFNNPFGSRYSQEVIVKCTHSNNKIIQIDAQCNLDIMEE